jgi:hypothetical protein
MSAVGFGDIISIMPQAYIHLNMCPCSYLNLIKRHLLFFLLFLLPSSSLSFSSSPPTSCTTTLTARPQPPLCVGSDYDIFTRQLTTASSQYLRPRDRKLP